jgi:hypothetical protein
MKQPSPAKSVARDGEIRLGTEHAKRVGSRYVTRLEPGQPGIPAISGLVGWRRRPVCCQGDRLVVITSVVPSTPLDRKSPARGGDSCYG